MRMERGEFLKSAVAAGTTIAMPSLYAQTGDADWKHTWDLALAT